MVDHGEDHERAYDRGKRLGSRPDDDNDNEACDGDRLDDRDRRRDELVKQLKAIRQTCEKHAGDEPQSKAQSDLKKCKEYRQPE